MNKLLTLTLILASFVCFSQVKPDSLHKKIILSKGETLTIKNQQSFMMDASRQYVFFQKQIRARDSVYGAFLQITLTANGIDLSRVSDKGDSLKITDKEILVILKPKRK